MTRQTLALLGYPDDEIQRYIDTVRRDHYDTALSTVAEQEALEQMQVSMHQARLRWFPIKKQNTLIGRTLAEASLGEKTGATVVALEREQQMISNLASSLQIQANDVLGVMGNAAQINAAEQVLEQGAE